MNGRVEFVLLDGTVPTASNSNPPALFKITLSVADISQLRSKAALVLRSSGGDAQKFLASTLAAQTQENRGIREMVACVLVHMAADTPERLSVVMGGSLNRVGFVVTRDRQMELSVALGRLRMPVGTRRAGPPIKTATKSSIRSSHQLIRHSV